MCPSLWGGKMEDMHCLLFTRVFYAFVSKPRYYTIKSLGKIKSGSLEQSPAILAHVAPVVRLKYTSSTFLVIYTFRLSDIAVRCEQTAPKRLKPS